MIRPRLRIPLRPRLATAPAPAYRMATRSIHALPPLEYNIKNEASQNGIPEFLSPAAFNISWTQYQTHCLEKLNVLTAGTFTWDLFVALVWAAEC